MTYLLGVLTGVLLSLLMIAFVQQRLSNKYYQLVDEYIESIVGLQCDIEDKERKIKELTDTKGVR